MLGSENPNPKQQNVLTTEISPTTKHTNQKRAVALPSFKHRWWWWEIGGTAVSFASISAIAVSLIILDNRPLVDWTLPIAPNSLIAVFSAIAKAALLLPVAESISQLKWLHFQRSQILKDMQLFDDASRGPWGALQFLFRKSLKAPLAAWGAVVTLGALAIDPSAQQILAFPSREVSMGVGSASVGIAQVFEADANRVNVSFSGSTQWQGAMLNGLFGIDPRIAFDCPTGNCHWPDFTSLAVCGSCANVTASTGVDCNYINGNDAFVTCTFGTPGWFRLTARSDYGPTAFVAQAKGSVRVTTTFDNQDELKPTNWLTNFGAVKVSAFDVAARQASANVSECAFYWCMQTYSGTSATNSTLTVELIKEELLNITDDSTGDNTNHTTMQVASTGDAGAALANMTFLINGDDRNTLTDMLAALFTTQVSVEPGFVGPGVSGSSGSYVGMGDALYASSDIAQSVKAVATSLTNMMRTTGNSTKAYGEAFQNQTFVNVRRGWLILPVAFVVLAAVLLVVTAVHSSRHQTVLWKSSSLALLFHALEGWPVAEHDCESIAELHRRAEDMHAALKPSQSGMLLVNSDENI